MLRVVLFVATNLAVMLLLGIVVKLFGIDAWSARHGVDYGGLLVLSAVMGIGGSFISLALSKWLAKHSTGARVIGTPRDETERWLLAAVRQHAEKAGIGMPEVAIYDAPDLNAFATGASRNHALVAVSSGLLGGMSRLEIDAVLAHEISHVANGDMVTLTLLQGVLNTFVIFFARILANVVDSAMRGNRDSDEGGGLVYFIIVMLLQTVLGVFASLIVLAFSRWREFRADAGGAKLAGRAAMIAALQRLGASHGDNSLPKEVRAFGIASDGAVARLFMSHPPLAERIAALRAAG